MSKQLPTDSELRDRIRAAGLRATGSRVAVLRCLARARAPLSHAEVYESILDSGNDRATVYRNLVDLAEAGFLRRTDIDHVWRFEWLGDEPAAHSATAHAHFVCSRCGTVACLPESVVSLRATRTSPKTVRSKDVEVHVRGLCDACG